MIAHSDRCSPSCKSFYKFNRILQISENIRSRKNISFPINLDHIIVILLQVFYPVLNNLDFNVE